MHRIVVEFNSALYRAQLRPEQRNFSPISFLRSQTAAALFLLWLMFLPYYILELQLHQSIFQKGITILSYQCTIIWTYYLVASFLL